MFPDLELAAVSVEIFFIDISGADRSMSPQNQRIFANALQAAYNPGPFANLRDFWDVDFLAVDPAFRRRGIGAALLERVQNTATEEGVPVTLLATIMGSHLYRKVGFTGLGEVKTGLYHLFEPMIWYPKESEETHTKELGDP
jgi:GNAT superfamily N-acetyltransferase